MNQPPYASGPGPYPGSPYGAAPPQPPPQKKGLSGCAIAAIVVLGIFAVACAVGGYFIWKAANFVADVAKDGLNGPGTAELRAKGCDVPLVLDLSKVSALFDGGTATTKDEAAIAVMCTVEGSHTPPTCDVVAQTYASAAHPKVGFVATVQTSGGKGPVCERLYSSSGAFVKDKKK